MAKGVILIDDDLLQEKIFEHCVHLSSDIWQFHYFKDDNGLLEFVGKLGPYFKKLIIFCDYHLGVTNGIVLLEKILKLTVLSQKGVRLYLISSEFNKEQIAFAEANGIFLLQKPIQKDDIRQILDEN